MGAYNGSGQFIRSYSWVQDAANAINITASRFDTEDDGFASGLTNCITRDGQGVPTANISWGGYDLSNVTVKMLAGSLINDPVSGTHPVGYRGVPQNAQTGAYALVLNDVGKHVFITTGGITVPANATTAFAIGDAITIINNNTVAQNIAPAGGVTMRFAGTSLTGTRSMGPYALATIVKTGTDEWMLAGTGMS